MHVVLGADGHVGAAVASTLLDAGEDVTVVLHREDRMPEWRRKGAIAVVADVHDVDALVRVFRSASRLFLLNPPADPAGDAPHEERTTVNRIVDAVFASDLELVVAESAYGAQPGEAIGDLSVLYEMEQRLSSWGGRVAILRAAYYMSNWDAALRTARDEGVVHILYPVDFTLPMVAPQDIGGYAAGLMRDAGSGASRHDVEGPAHYSAIDVARAFSVALRRTVTAVETPPKDWLAALQALGFSPSSARAFATMTASILQAGPARPEHPFRGPTSLQAYVDGLVRADG